jgi:hypothetical protein
MKYQQMHSIVIYCYINTLLHVSAPESAIFGELEVILMKLLIYKGGGERRNETVCGCVQLKDPSVNKLQNQHCVCKELTGRQR